MKNRIILPLIVVAAMSSCQRSGDNHAKTEEERSAVQAAADALDAERARVQAEREALEAEKEELRLQRVADLAAKEADLQNRESALELQSEEARLAAEALAAEQEALALREQELSAVEMQQAGTTVIADWTPDEPEIVQEPVADYSLFYDELEPHGDWFETPDYGYVYQPTVVIQNRSWRPYTYGKWVCSNLGWTWRSDEPFGWATFHYGRWALLSGRGWCWVPGSEWAPSWCAWREGGGHVGWAPLPPETLAYRGRGWGANVDVELGIASSCFNFVESRYMANPLAKHCLPVSRNAAFIRSTRGCTNIQFQRNRIVSGGPSYADIYLKVNKPWPVCQLDLDSVGGFGRGRGHHDLRQGVRRGNHLQVFAPSVDAPWNPGLRPNRVAESWKNVNVVRADSGLQQTWSRRLAEARERQQENARSWAQKNDDLKAARERQLQANREKVAAAQARIRENVARNISLRQQRITGAQPQPQGPVANVPDRNGPVAGTNPGRNGPREATGMGNTPDRTGPRNGEATIPDRNGPRNGPATAVVPDRNGPRTGGGMANGRDGDRGGLPPGVTRPADPRAPTAGVPPTRSPEKVDTSADDRLAEIRRKQQEARDKAAQRNAEIQARLEEARNARSQPRSSNNGGNTDAAAMQARQQREQEAAQKAAQQAQAKADLQERLRQQQENNRAAQEQAKMDIQRKAQEQQERVRAAQEQAKQAQAERARQQAEQARQKEMADRQAAEQAARERQAAAQRAAEQRAQQQAEMARRQEEAQRAAQEQARQQQERAREAAEQRARQQQENQERARQAQEQMREKLREQQEKRKNR